MDSKKESLKRKTYEMPEDVLELLEFEKLLQDYRDRPGYQQNDYLSWIARARQPTTRQKRITQMLGELRKGGVYMNITHPSSKKTL